MSLLGGGTVWLSDLLIVVQQANGGGGESQQDYWSSSLCLMVNLSIKVFKYTNLMYVVITYLGHVPHNKGHLTWEGVKAVMLGLQINLW